MHFLRLPQLWFLTAGAGGEIQKDVSLNLGVSVSVTPTLDFIGTDIAVCVSTVYLVTTSTYPISSVDVEFSAFSYRASVSGSTQVLVSIDVADGAFSSLELGCTITPVYVLEQTGMAVVSTSLACFASISAVATIAPFVTVNATYNASISASIGLLIADNTSIAFAAQATASIALVLLIQQDTLEKNVIGNYGISCSVSPTVLIPSTGGLVWSRKKQRYVAVRVGNAS